MKNIYKHFFCGFAILSVILTGSCHKESAHINSGSSNTIDSIYRVDSIMHVDSIHTADSIYKIDTLIVDSAIGRFFCQNWYSSSSGDSLLGYDTLTILKGANALTITANGESFSYTPPITPNFPWIFYNGGPLDMHYVSFSDHYDSVVYQYGYDGGIPYPTSSYSKGVRIN